jgi:GDP-mannose 6-dehydrogenase
MSNEKKQLSICVFGMGYVGCVSAACLAGDGHIVTCIDVSEGKLKAIEAGKAPVEEPGLERLIADAVAAGRMRVSRSPESAIEDADLSFICVGTPSQTNGSINLDYVERVCRQIGQALAKRRPGHVVVVRSTCLPGTMAQLVRPTLESASGRKHGEHFFTAFNPEFLREGSAIRDYRKPPKVVIGTDSEYAANLMKAIYGYLDAPFIVLNPEVAEMVKYVDNAWHALKIVFGNEIGELCLAAGVDSHAVMDVFLQDKQLNISPAYLRPGFAFGGSCLPKDLRALMHFIRHRDLHLPVLDHTLSSNAATLERVIRRILSSDVKRVGIYGLSFKPNTDDLRESPLVTLAERLIGKGLEIRIYDEYIQMEKLTGTNREYIDRHLPHLVRLLVNGFDYFDNFAEMVVIGHRTERAVEWVGRRDRKIKIFDLVRLTDQAEFDNYEGISW